MFRKVMYPGAALLLVLALAVAIGQTSDADTRQPGDISLDDVEGLYQPGQIRAGVDIRFTLRLNNNTGYNIVGLSNGFRIYSPDGATWSPLIADKFSHDWAGWFDLFFLISSYSVNGSGADTVGFNGGVLSGTGLPDGFDDQVWWIETQVYAPDDGLTLCLDSSWFPPNGLWVWTFQSQPAIYPDWDGPHCFEIVDVPNSPPEITNCPGYLQGNHCEMMVYDFDADDPDGDDYWFEHLQGPGTINPSTGLWEFYPGPYDIGWHPLEVRACDQYGCGAPCYLDIEITNEPPFFIYGCDTIITVYSGQTVDHYVQALDPDYCDMLVFLGDVHPSPTGPFSIDQTDPMTAHFHFEPDAADLDTFQVTIDAVDMAGVPAFCEFKVVILPYPAPTPGWSKHNTNGYKPGRGSPVGSTWHELWPDYCHDWVLTDWIDNDDGNLSYCDTVEFTDADGRKMWEHVKKVLPTLTVTAWDLPIMYLDGLDPNPNIDDIYEPIGTYWHEVYPNYGRVWEIVYLEEGEPNGVLDSCDYIGLLSVDEEAVEMEVHVEAFETDIVTTPIPPAVGKTSDNTDGFKPSMGNPIGTYWHELYRNFCRGWIFTGLHDEGDGILSEGDIIHVTDQESGQTIYEKVDWVGKTLALTDFYTSPDTMYLEAITPQPDTSSEVTQPAGSMWQEVHPTYGVIHQIFSWSDSDDNGMLNFCDYVYLQILSGPDSGCFGHAHVEGVRTDIRTSPATARGRIRDNPEYPPPVDPFIEPWHELWPNYCTDWVPTDLKDNGDGILSYCDTIEFTNVQTGRSIWEHIKWVGPTIGLTDYYVPDSDTAYFEPVSPMPGAMDNPEGTIWHEVHPNYCILVKIESFTDYGNPGLDPGDFMMVHFISGPDSCSLFHGRVATVGTDMTTEPLSPPYGPDGPYDPYGPNGDPPVWEWDQGLYDPGEGDPTGTEWTEMWENYDFNWEIGQWSDGGDGFLSYGDNIRLQSIDIPDSAISGQIEQVTVGISAVREGPDTLHLAYMWDNPMAEPIADPLFSYWLEVQPEFQRRWICEGWADDNSSGYLDPLDSLWLAPVDGPDSGLVTVFLVTGEYTWFIKIVLPFCDYYKQQYVDYAPQSGPDFDMKQTGWVCPDNVYYPSIWNHDGPASVANCLWWFDSKFEPTPVDPHPFYPPFNHDDHYPLVESYNPLLWDDHDTNNVYPFISELSTYMNTCNWIYHGTHIDSLVSGTRQYIASKGLSHNYVDTLVEGPTHPYITDQVHQSQDVVLLLGFYEYDYVIDEYFLIGGHYVMVPGFCTYDRRLCISDPWFDALEGEPPAGSVHGGTVHNDANNISGPHSQIQHDPYYTNPISLMKYPRPNEMLLGYPVDSLDMVQFQNLNLFGDRVYSGGPITTTIEYAYVICPDSTPVRWDFHFRGYDACPGGTLSVWGTINCNKVGGPIYEQYVNTSTTYAGPVPSWANDIEMRFAWDYWCHNVSVLKIAAPTYVGGVWRLLRLNPWINGHVRSDIDLPTIGDPTGVIQNVYYVVDLQQWLADPRPMLEEYDIIDGECSDLPGYLIGTTPIVFDSLAPPTRGTPFSTTPFTGTLYRDGEAYMSKGGMSCCIPPIRGDIDYSTGIIDIADLVYLVDFMFNVGPEPPCFEEGDVDASGVAPIDIADLVYLVDYMFNQGPEPALCP